MAFQELCSRADQHAHDERTNCQECMAWYAEAVSLYRGEFLQGVYPADSIIFSEWALLKREHLQLEALRLLYLLAAYYQRRGELDLALSYALRQLEMEPWREEAHCQVMTILALRGERSAALHQYDRCRRMLNKELGIEPARETRALYERILAARKIRQHNLPLQSTPFLGRKAELNQVNEYLSRPDCRLLTILGPGGIGKSRLALQVAEAQVYASLHGVFFAQLAGVNTPANLIRSIADALEIRFPPVRDPLAQLIDYLRHKELLLVLDNFEQLLGDGMPSAVAILEDFLENAPGLRLLITSRQRLSLGREWVFLLQGLPIPKAVLNQDLEDYESVQLFLQSTRRIDRGFQPTMEEEPAIVHICQLLEGVPLAIELAAAWIRVMSPAEIAQEIQSGLDFLAGSYQDLPERHRSLRATFEHSYSLLTLEEQQALCRLSIFPAGFDRLAAEQVAGANLAILTLLSDRSLLELVRIENRSPRLRFRMHELIRQFGSEKLSQDPAELKRTKDRHSSYYMSFLNARNSQVMGGTSAYQAGQEINNEVENVRLALEQAIASGNLNELGHSLNILMYFFEIQGLFEEAERLFGIISRCMEEAIREGRDADEIAGYYLGRAFMYHGWYCMHLARYDQAIELTQKGLALSRQSGDQEGHGLALNSLGVFATSQGKFQQAKKYLQEAIMVLSENGFTWSQAGALGNLGILARLEGDLSRAEELFHQSLDLTTRLDDLWAMAIHLDDLGDLALQQGNLEQAEQRFHQVLEIRQKLGQRWRVALSLNRLGGVAYRRREYAKAKSYYQESLAILRDFGQRVHLASTLVHYGEACLALSEYAEARESLHDALRLSQEMSADGTTVRALLGLATLLASEGKRGQSAEILGAISEHESLEHEDKEKAQSLLCEIQGSLPTQEFHTLVASGKHTALDDLVRVILQSDR